MEENTLSVSNQDKAVFNKGAANFLFIIGCIGCVLASCAEIAGVKSSNAGVIDDLVSLEWLGSLMETTVATIFIYGLKMKLRRDQIQSPGQGLMGWLFAINLILIPAATYATMALAMDKDAAEFSEFLLMPAIPLMFVEVVLALIAGISLLKTEKYKSLARWLLIYTFADFLNAIITDMSDSNTTIGYTAIICVFLAGAYFRKIADVLSEKK